MGDEKDDPEHLSFPLLAPPTGDTELMGRIKPEAKAQLVASLPKHGHNHITSPRLGILPRKVWGHRELGVVGSRLTGWLFLVGSVNLTRSFF